MAAEENSGAPGARNLPDHEDPMLFEAAISGLEPTGARVRVLPEIDAVELSMTSELDGAAVDFVLSAPAAITLSMALVRAVARLTFRGADRT